MDKKDGINLKLYLEPKLQKLEDIQSELGKTIQDVGEDKLTEKFNKIQTKINAIKEIFKGEFDFSKFKTAGQEIANIFKDIQNLSLEGANLDAIPGFNELEEKLNKTKEKIAEAEQKIQNIKKDGHINDENEFHYTVAHVNRQILANPELVRAEKVKGAGTQGTKIKDLDTLVNYFNKLKEQGLEETNIYKTIDQFLNNITEEETNRTNAYQKQIKLLNQQNDTADDIADKLKNLAENPISTTGINDQQIKQQETFNRLYADAAVEGGKVKKVVKEVSKAQDDAGHSTDRTTEDIKQQNNEVKKQEGVIGRAVKNFTSYTLVLGTLKKIGSTAKQTIEVLDNALTEQAMVSGRTKKELIGLLKTYQDIGKATGATTKEVAEVSTQYFRQGKTIKEATILTQAAVSAAKVGAISTADSVDYLTTAINGFGMAAEDATRVSDRFSALAANSATSYEELAVALSKVAAQAHLADMSMDFTLGLLAKGIETTREAPETIGTALKTIIARMREMTDYGKTLEDGVSVNNLQKQLDYVGISLTNVNGELRSSQEVLDEVGRNWDNFNKNQQAALAKAFAGTRQQSRFIAMMQGYGRTLELVNIAQESTGSTMAQMSTYMEGIEAATNKMSVAWESLITTFVNSEVIIDILQTVGNILEDISDFFGDAEKGATRTKTVVTGLITFLALWGLKIITNKTKEWLIQQAINVALREDKKNQIDKAKTLLTQLGVEERITAELIKQHALGTQDPVTKGAKTKAHPVKFLGSMVKGLSTGGKWGLGLAIGAAVVGAIGIGIAAAVKKNSKAEKLKRSKAKLEEQQAEIYKQKQTLKSINEATTAYKHFENQIIHTKEQQQEIEKSLDAAAEKLSEEEKKEYNLNISIAGKAKYLQDIKKKKEDILAATEKELMVEIENSDVQEDLLKTAEARSAVIHNALKVLPELEGGAKNRNTIENIMESTDETSEIYHSEDHGQEYVKQLNTKLNEILPSTEKTINEILSSSTESLSNQVAAFQALSNIFKGTPLEQAINAAYSGLHDFSEKFTPEQIDILSEKGITADYLLELQNKLLKASEESGVEITPEILMNLLGLKGESAERYLQDTFKGASDDATKVFTAIGDDLSLGLNNSSTRIAQDMDKYNNKIKHIQEIREKWKDLSEDEKRDFMETHPEIFENISIKDFINTEKDLEGELHEIYEKEINDLIERYHKNEDFYNEKARLAEENGNLEEALRNKNLAEVAKTERLKLEYAKKYGQRTLEERLKLQEQELKAAKEILKENKQKELDILNEKKEAYEEYYNSLDKLDQEKKYEEEKNLILSNISKLGGSTDANSLKIRDNLENNLAELQKQRQETLKQERREAVLNNIDNDIEDIQNWLEKLEEGTQNIVDAINAQGGVNNVTNSGISNIVHSADTWETKADRLNNLVTSINPNINSLKLIPDQPLIDYYENDGQKSILININNGSDQPYEIPVSDASAEEIWRVIKTAMDNSGHVGV